jgi:SRSO17 transposase
MDLHLPKSWLEDPRRRAQAHIPESLLFRPKWQMALDMVDRALAARLPTGIINADAWYGTVAAFRGGLTARGLVYLLDVSDTKVLATLANPSSLRRFDRPVTAALRETTRRPPGASAGSRRPLGRRTGRERGDCLCEQRLGVCAATCSHVQRSAMG